MGLDDFMLLTVLHYATQAEALEKFASHWISWYGLKGIRTYFLAVLPDENNLAFMPVLDMINCHDLK